MDITQRNQLEDRYGKISERARNKVLSALDVHCRNFINLSPFLVISSSAADGKADVSPKGDPPGFVAVLDERTLLIPDRPGNNRLDGMKNILENPHVGILFMIPGVKEILRVNGRARITADPALLEPLAVDGKVPSTGLLVDVDEAFLHCPKAMVRSRLWEDQSRIDRARLPTMGQMMADQIGGFKGEDVERDIQRQVRERLY